jgi:putative ABC transport system ATP-binding protein
MPKKEKLLTIKNVTKIFDIGEVKVKALSNVSFDIYEGELIVILGPSGSGKSTMLNIIGGIEAVTEGEIFYKNIPLHNSGKDELTQYRRNHIGFIFQFYNLMPNLTALENIMLISEMSSDPIDAKMLLDRVGLSDRAFHFPSRLSGGQQQRIAIARAVCKNPDLLLCDEPTGALDIKTGIQILKLLSDFNRDYKKTVVIITHNSDIAQIADRIFFFKDGRIDNIKENENPISPLEVCW